MHSKLRRLSLSVALMTTAATAQPGLVRLERRSPGALGTTLDFAFENAPGPGLLFCVGRTAGPTPLGAVGPPWALAVDTSLARLWFPVLPDPTGSGTVSLGPTRGQQLHGVVLHFQLLAYDTRQTPNWWLDLSNPAVTQIATSGAGVPIPSTLSVARSLSAVFRDVLTGEVVIAGGGDWSTAAGLSARADVDVFDPQTLSARPAPALMTARGFATATALRDGRVLIAGGGSDPTSPLASALLYDPSSRSFTATRSMAHGRMVHSAARLPNGDVLVVGGTNDLTMLGPGSMATAERYDPASNSWSPAAPAPRAVSGAALTALDNGLVLLSGGFRHTAAGWQVSTMCDLYDPVANHWSPAGAMPVARVFHADSTLKLTGPNTNGSVLATGGLGNAGAGNAIADCSIYDPALDAWHPHSTLPTPTAMHTIFERRNGDLVIIGGGQGSLIAPRPLDAIAILPAAGTTWSTIGALTSARALHRTAVLEDETIVVFGGQGQNGQHPLDSIETVRL